MNKKLTGYPSIDKPQNIGASFFEKNPIIPDMSIYSSIKLINMMYKKKNAINCLDLNVSYEKLFEDAVMVSKSLLELGVKKGQIIAVSMPNYYQAIAVFLGCNRIGAVTTFLNPNATREQICNYLNTFESPVFINYNNTFEENFIYKTKTKTKYIVTLNQNELSNKMELDKNKYMSKEIFLSYSQFSKIGKNRFEGITHNNGNSDALILFTSGSTGNPKSVVLTNKNIIAAGTYLKNSSRVKSLNGDSTLVCVPFSYPYGFATSTLMTLMSSKTAILAPDISKDTISYYLKKNPNIIFGSPALLELIMKNIPEYQDLSSITTFISGGDFLTPSHSIRANEFFEKHGAYGVEIGNGSGNAETVSCGTNPTGVKIRPETAGKVLVGTDAMIIDPNTLSEKKYNEEGLLCVSGKHVFKEYYKNPEATKNAKININGKEYFKTGTLGFIDEEGYFTLTGRDSRFYITSSLDKVYCDRVQNLLYNFDEIKECAIVKVPDDEKLYVNKAYIVLNDNYLPIRETEESIRFKLDFPIKTYTGTDTLKSCEKPTYIKFIEQLPRKEGTDKVDYNYLEELAIKELSIKELVKK